jgi:hypothetical protein
MPGPQFEGDQDEGLDDHEGADDRGDGADRRLRGGHEVVDPCQAITSRTLPPERLNGQVSTTAPEASPRTMPTYSNGSKSR